MEALEKMVRDRISPEKGLDAVLTEIANDPKNELSVRILACQTLTKDQH